MKMQFSIIAIVLTLLSGGWSKESSRPATSSVAKKLSGTTLKNGQTIVYNANGTPQTVSWTVAGSVYTQTFSYYNDKICYITTSDSKKTEQGEFVVKNGKIISLDWTHFDAKEQAENIYAEKFSYNDKGLLQKHSFNKSWSEYNYNNDNDLTRIAHFNESGRATTVVEYTYTRVKDLFPAMGYFKPDASSFFLPDFSKHLPASRKVTKVATGQLTRKGVFKYELDTDGYLLKGKWDASVGEESDYEWTNRFQ